MKEKITRIKYYKEKNLSENSINSYMSDKKISHLSNLLNKNLIIL